MVYKNLGKKSLSHILAMAFAVSGCMPSDVPTTRGSFNAANPDGQGSTVAGAGAGNSSGSGSGDTSILPKVEIRHLIEPNLSYDPNYSSGTGYAGGGSYVRKLTLPKNYQGKLYLAGININTLANRHVKVRFKFGVGRDAVTIPAVVSRAPGITPQTDIHVLVMDMRSEPFRNVRLPYDLFDYNEYGPSDTPVQDNRDTGLYCRGLRVEDDPTFVGVGQCDGAQPDEECLYAYAKVMDQGLVKEVISPTSKTYIPTVPTAGQMRSVTGTEYYQDKMAEIIKRPLSDNYLGPFKFSEAPTVIGATDSINLDFLISSTPFSLDWQAKNINGANYYYRGPYRVVNKTEWHFKFNDLVGNKRLFKNARTYSGPDVAVPGYGGATSIWGTKAVGQVCSNDGECTSGYCSPSSYTCATTSGLGASCTSDVTCSSRFCDPASLTCARPLVYFGSYMFPLATQTDLSANVAHLSSNNWSDVRSPTSLTVSGKTLWMDGSNARARSKNTDLEHIGSCNVSATMEIIAKDDNGNEYVISLSDEVKLQLVRPIQHYTDLNTDVLYTNFKTCSSNASCGSGECCFNNRCWDKTLVSQCFDSSNIQGNRPVGDSCSTDMDCSSLCCNRSSGLCSPHNTLLDPAVLCSKPIGDFCIAKEWCQKTPVVKCLIVKTPSDVGTGQPGCYQQCYTTLEYGDCKAGTCVAPYQEPIPTFDPYAEGACDNAVPAPNF